MLQNNIPIFFYTASLNYGQVYYISPIAGLDNSGVVNVNDPCLTVSPGVPIIFYPQPTADMLNTNVSACSGMDAELEIYLTGEGPYILYLENSTGPVPGSPFTILSSPFIYSTSIEDTYTIVAVANDNCSGNSTQSQATVTSNDIPSVSANENFVFCENGLNQLELNFTGEGPWTLNIDLDGVPQPPIIYANANSLQTIVSEGTYVLTGISDLNCFDNISDTIEVSFFENPSAIIFGGESFCQGDSALIEFQFSGGSPDYTFSYTDGTFNYGPFTNSNGSFSFFSGSSGNYQIIDLNDENCPGSFAGNASNTALDLPTVDISLSSNAICDGELVTIELEFNENGPFDLDFVNNGDTTALQVIDGYQITLSASDTSFF